MKNIFAIFLALLLTLALPLAALAQETEMDTTLEGLVTELVEGGFIMEDKDMGSVMLNVDDTTVMDGILAESEIAVGQYVYVTYDGRMTRSLPPQAHADRVGCYVLTGSVSELMDIGVLLTGDALFGDVIVRPGENELPPLYAGMPVTVYYNGVMAMSLPGQVSASHVVVPELTGVVSEKDDEGFTLTDENGETYRVLVAGETVIHEKLPEDEPAQDEAADDTELLNDEAEQEEAAAEEERTGEEAAEESEPADEEEPAEEETEDALTDEEEPIDPDFLLDEEIDLDAEWEEDAHLPPVQWGDGDTVTVYFSGAMTRSIPAQLSALEIVVIR